jgi:6-phosphogluconolactonase
MPGEVSPEEGALTYEREMIDYFLLKEGEFPVFDLIYLGLGNDGHTASLFPGHKALEETRKLVVAVKGGDPHVSRLTLTYPVLNHARQIVFMVSGKGKSPVLKTMFENRNALLPAQRVRPSHGKMNWLLDKEAASLLSGGMVYA